MNTYASDTEEKKHLPADSYASQLQSNSESTFELVDNRPSTITQQKMQEKANISPHTSQLKTVQNLADSHTTQQQRSIQNNTGLPISLKTGIEHLSGISLDDVKVHRNSDKPAQLQAHAYAQGTDIHLGSGQENHLPHEAWHAIQQKRGRVKPTIQMIGNALINDDAELKNESDVMGQRALQNPTGHQDTPSGATNNKLLQEYSTPAISNSVMQRAVGFEFECNWQVERKGRSGGLQSYPKKTLLHSGAGWTMETDGTDIEFVVDHVAENNDGRLLLASNMTALAAWVNGMNLQKAADPLDNPDFITAAGIRQHSQVNTYNEDISANPQTTGGIRLDRLETLYRSLSKRPPVGQIDPAIPEATKVLGGQGTGFYATKAQGSVRVIEAVKSSIINTIPASDKLAGLVALICQYLEFGKGENPLTTPKYMAWIMARTQFGAMFSSTPEAPYLQQNPGEWVALVLNTGMTAMSGEVLASENAVIERPITDGGNLSEANRIHIPITRDQWLRSMTQGIDVLTKSAQQTHWYSSRAHKKTYNDTRTKLGHRLRGLGGLGKATDTTEGGDRAEILEFRSMKNGVPSGDWKNLTLRVFDFIKAINSAPNANSTIDMQP